MTTTTPGHVLTSGNTFYSEDHEGLVPHLDDYVMIAGWDLRYTS